MTRPRHSPRAVLLLALVAAAACVPVPDPDTSGLPTPGAPGLRLVLVLHGSGDDPSVWAEDAITRIAPSLPEPESWTLHAHDWSERAADRGAAAGRGVEEGRALGAALAEMEPGWDEVLVVSHSAGAFVAYEVIETLRRERPEVRLHGVFLDPFGLRALDNWVFGEHHFGEEADFAQSYFNADDGAPTTDTPLRECHNVDVTAQRPADWPEGRAHWWPIEYWVRQVESPTRADVGADTLSRFAQGEDLHARLPRGETLTP